MQIGRETGRSDRHTKPGQPTSLIEALVDAPKRRENAVEAASELVALFLTCTFLTLSARSSLLCSISDFKRHHSTFFSLRSCSFLHHSSPLDLSIH